MLALSLEDNGAGIAPETNDGYGLTTMRERVVALGGAFRVAQASPGGVTVKVSIPLDMNATRAPSSWSKTHDAHPRHRRPPHCDTGLSTPVHRCGHEGCPDGIELLRCFREYRREKPDIILVDLAINSVTYSGLSFIRRLRVHDRRTAVLVFSMHSDPVIVSRALALGANGYILRTPPPTNS